MKNGIIRKLAVPWIALILAFCLAACSAAGGADTAASQTSSVLTPDTAATAAPASTEASVGTETAPEAAADADTFFSDSDTKDVTSETADAEIVLSGSEGTISDTTRGSSGSVVTITSKGIYHVTGTSRDVTILIRDETESGNIYLILDNVEMTSSTDACIRVESADKVILQCVGTNSLTYTNGDDSAEIDGAVYSRDDLTINGTGTLQLTSSLHGIVCKDDLKITSGTLSIEAEAIGIRASDSFRFTDADLTVVSGHDGIQVSDSDGDAYAYIGGGSLAITAGYDGIDTGTDAEAFSGFIRIDGGTVSMTAGGGSGSSKDSSTSQKGLKCDGAILLNGGEVIISSADDAVHAGTDVKIGDGTLTVSSSDDGIHAEDTLTISAGTVMVTKSYEGLEAETVTINGGDIQVYASDDGINAAGGSDSQSDEAWSMGGPWGSSSATGTLTVNGGSLYVNASGDGLDSNGSLYVTGGTVIVEGPENNGNGALDIGDGSGCVASITGGTVLAIGSSGMAVNFNAGTQCSALVSLSGSAGTEISVDDGSGFTFTASKTFQCAVYSSPELAQGGSCTISAGSQTASMNFSSGMYVSDVSSMGGMSGGPGGKH